LLDPVPRVLIFVACVKTKIWDKYPNSRPFCKAKDAYVSDYFKKNKQYAEKFGEEWFVFSAKYGLLSPDKEIENYNATFRLGSPDCITLETLKAQVHTEQIQKFKRIQVLGGKAYVSLLRKAISPSDCVVDSPLSGLRIGESKREVARALKAGRMLTGTFDQP
jgi:hypothetical protein